MMLKQETGNMKVEVEIGRLPQSRWEDYRKIRLEGLSGDPEAFVSTYAEEVKYGQDVWENRIKNALFALVDGKPVGVVTCIAQMRDRVSHVADIFGMYVRKDYRQSGIGTKLLKVAVSSILENKGVRKINLSVTSSQRAALALYLKEGFVIAGTRKSEIRGEHGYLDEILMEKIIIS